MVLLKFSVIVQLKTVLFPKRLHTIQVNDVEISVSNPLEQLKRKMTS